MALGIASIIGGIAKGMGGGKKPPKPPEQPQSGQQMAQKILPPADYRRPDYKPGEGYATGGAVSTTAIVPVAKPKVSKTGNPNLDNALENVAQSAAGLEASLKSFVGFKKQTAEKKRKAAVIAKRNMLGTAAGAVAGAALGFVKKPAQNFLEMFKRFVFNVALGSLVTFLVEQYETIKRIVGEVLDVIEPVWNALKDWVLVPVWSFLKWTANQGAKMVKEIAAFPPIKAGLDTLKEKLREFEGMFPELERQVKYLSSGNIDDVPPMQQGGTRSRPAPGGRLGPGDAPDATYDRNLAKLLKNYEGLRTKAYKDSKGIPTIGMGATYYPKGFRLQGAVKMGDVITEEEALQIKEAHIREHRGRLTRQIGEENYNKLPNNVKAALESIVFNYGSLDSKTKALVMEGIKTGNYNKLADDIENRLGRHDMQPDGKGLNQHRRTDEANIIRGGKSKFGVQFRRTTIDDVPPMQQGQAGQAFATGLKTGASRFIGGSSEYHIDTKLKSELSMQKKVEYFDQMSMAYAKQGRVIEFSNQAVAGRRYDHTMSYQEKAALLQAAAGAHAPRAGYASYDYYIPQASETRFGKSAEGAEIFVPTEAGGSVQYGSGGRYGAYVVMYDAQGKEIGRTGHGDIRGAKSGTVQISPSTGDTRAQSVSTTPSYQRPKPKVIPVPIDNTPPMQQKPAGATSSGGLNNNMWSRASRLGSLYQM